MLGVALTARMYEAPPSGAARTGLDRQSPGTGQRDRSATLQPAVVRMFFAGTGLQRRLGGD